MRVLFFGDVVGGAGTEAFRRHAPRLRREYGADLIIVNGENSERGNGITKRSAGELFSGGADVITTGNHCFRRRDSEVFADERVLRPANYPEGVTGHGFCVLDCGSYRFAVVNLMGTAYMEPLDNPFAVIDRILPELNTKNILVDFHAEATAEKRAMGYHLEGRVSALIGTHTHVQTADEEILGGHTGYLTDAGMTGGERSVLGVNVDAAVEKQRFHTPVTFTEADAPCMICGAALEIDSKTGICTKIERIFMRESTKSR